MQGVQVWLWHSVVSAGSCCCCCYCSHLCVTARTHCQLAPSISPTPAQHPHTCVLVCCAVGASCAATETIGPARSTCWGLATALQLETAETPDTICCCLLPAC